MRQLNRSAILLGLVALAGALPCAAQDLNGFLPARGEATLALSYTAEGYDEFWRGNTLVSNPGVGAVDIRSLSLWGRYGVTDRLALVVNVPYIDAEGDGTGGFADSGLGDLTALAELRLAEGGGATRHSLTGAAGLRTPLSDYEANAPVSLGDGTTDALFRLVYQLERGGFYLSQQVGYDLRGEDAPDGIALHTELGYTFGRATVSAFYTRYLADDGTDIGDPGFTFPSNREEYERLGGKLYLRLNQRLGLSAAAFTTLDGRNTGDTTGVSVGGVFGF